MTSENPWRGCICSEGNKTGCPVHDAAACDAQFEPNGETHKVFNYECLVLDTAGNGLIENLDAVSTSHAFEEAWYVFDGKCVAVKRGEYMYPNSL